MALVLSAALGIQTSSQAGPPPLVNFSAEEQARIAAHGPWPMPRQRDPGNRVDGQAAAIELGRLLFTETGLSASGKLSCAACHMPGSEFQDGRRFTRHGRNTPSLLNARQQRWFGWDGAADSLWAASLMPLIAVDEMAATPATGLALLKAKAALGVPYQALFGVPQADEALLVNLAKSLAAYQATLVSPRTQFDEFRDGLVAGDAVSSARVTARYPAAAQRGLKLFVGAGRCFLCHSGPSFSNGEFADIGRPFFTPNGVDPGRWGGLNRLLSSPYNRLGAFSDAGRDDPSAQATRHVLMEPRHFGEFKVPGLRGQLATAPYFHDGSATTLHEVLRHYSEVDENRLHADGANLIKALKLSPGQIDDLVAFLGSLSTPVDAPANPPTRP